MTDRSFPTMRVQMVRPGYVGIQIDDATEYVMPLSDAADLVGMIQGATSEGQAFDAWFWIPCRRNRLDHLERAYINALMPPWNRDPVTVKQRAAGV